MLYFTIQNHLQDRIGKVPEAAGEAQYLVRLDGDFACSAHWK